MGISLWPLPTSHDLKRPGQQRPKHPRFTCNMASKLWIWNYRSGHTKGFLLRDNFGGTWWHPRMYVIIICYHSGPHASLGHSLLPQDCQQHLHRPTKQCIPNLQFFRHSPRNQVVFCSWWQILTPPLSLSPGWPLRPWSSWLSTMMRTKKPLQI